MAPVHNYRSLNFYQLLTTTHPNYIDPSATPPIVTLFATLVFLSLTLLLIAAFLRIAEWLSGDHEESRPAPPAAITRERRPKGLGFKEWLNRRGGVRTRGGGGGGRGGRRDVGQWKDVEPTEFWRGVGSGGGGGFTFSGEREPLMAKPRPANHPAGYGSIDGNDETTVDLASVVEGLAPGPEGPRYSVAASPLTTTTTMASGGAFVQKCGRGRDRGRFSTGQEEAVRGVRSERRRPVLRSATTNGVGKSSYGSPRERVEVRRTLSLPAGGVAGRNSMGGIVAGRKLRNNGGVGGGGGRRRRIKSLDSGDVRSGGRGRGGGFGQEWGREEMRRGRLGQLAAIEEAGTSVEG